MKKSYTHVFRDWNGTIIDDLKINFSVINTLLSDRKRNTISLSQYRQAFTFPIKEFYGRVGLPINNEEYEKLVSDYWALYKSKSKDIPLMVGMLEVLKEYQCKYDDMQNKTKCKTNSKKHFLRLL